MRLPITWGKVLLSPRCPDKGLESQRVSVPWATPPGFVLAAEPALLVTRLGGWALLKDLPGSAGTGGWVGSYPAITNEGDQRSNAELSPWQGASDGLLSSLARQSERGAAAYPKPRSLAWFWSSALGVPLHAAVSMVHIEVWRRWSCYVNPSTPVPCFQPSKP